MKPFQWYQAMWPNDKCVVNVAYPQAGFEWGRDDGPSSQYVP